MTPQHLRQMKIEDLSIDKISALLADKSCAPDLSRSIQFRFPKPARPAAVLIAFQSADDAEGKLQIVYTRRTDTVPDHKGQVAFPGGRTESCDTTPVDTALREAYEEIGVAPQDVTILGNLDPILTISNYLVTPVVGYIPFPYIFTPEPGEVSRVFTIPIDWLANPTNFEIRSREVGPPILEVPQSFRVVYFKPYDEEILWGVSAEITLRLMTCLQVVR